MGSIDHDKHYHEGVHTSSEKRGLTSQLSPGVIKDAQGKMVWDCDAYGYLKGACPETANQRLWEMSGKVSQHGLFEIAPSIYQVRGLDLSNITFIEGQEGVVVIDPLISNECARAALELYHSQRGARRVTGVIYTHSHTDHFGGAAGICTDTSIPIVAPEGFMEEAVNENIVAGPAMLRRARYMYGTGLPRSPAGNIGIGLGLATSKGTTSLIPPNTHISRTGERLIIDGVEFIFQIVSGTEAPSEFNFYLPNMKALCISECATYTMHNITTLRGAEVRDAKAWSACIDESLQLYGYESNVLFASHHWPTWGNKEVVDFLTDQRDLYGFMHNQTVRLMNQGMNGTEIAEVVRLPLSLQCKDHVQGYYGSLSHNIKGIYQKYMTWFDGNPVNLWKHPPAEEGRRYVECFGGVENVIEHAMRYEKEGDLRFAATLLGHAVSGYPENVAAKSTLADVFTKLGYGSENATWRNFYLTGALDLRTTLQPPARHRGFNPVLQKLSVEKWMDVLCIEIDSTQAEKDGFTIDLEVLDESTKWKLMLSNATLTCRQVVRSAQLPIASLNISTTKDILWHVLQGFRKLEDGMYDGDLGALDRLVELLR